MPYYNFDTYYDLDTDLYSSFEENIRISLNDVYDTIYAYFDNRAGVIEFENTVCEFLEDPTITKDQKTNLLEKFGLSLRFQNRTIYVIDKYGNEFLTIYNYKFRY